MLRKFRSSYLKSGTSHRLALESLESRRLLTTIDLADLLPVNGDDGSLGFAVASDAYQRSQVGPVGDLNGDGIDDLMVRWSIRNDANDPRVESFVVFGTENGFPAIPDTSTLDGSNGFTINNTQVALFRDDGSFSSAGDFNGDGVDDLVITSPSFYVGAAYIIFGSTSGFDADVDVLALDGSDGFAIQEDIMWSTFAVSASSAGDLNGDGFDDIVDAGHSTVNSGVARVFFGVADGFSASYRPHEYIASARFYVRSSIYHEANLTDARTAGDLNGDGYDDITIRWLGSFSNFGASENYVVFGRAQDSGFQEVGLNIGGEMPLRTATGDLNGDGIGELIVSDDGRSRIVFGTNAAFPSTLYLDHLNGTDGLTIQQDNEGFGLVGDSTDFNGDGFDDLLVAAPSASANGVASAGKIYLLFGRSYGFSSDLTASDIGAGQGVVFNGFDASHSVKDVNAAGDLNGDGLGDVVINFADSTTALSFVVFGQALDVVTPDFDSDGSLTVDDLDALQASVGLSTPTAAIFDLDGDGLVSVADRNLRLVQAGAANRANGQPYLLGDANLDGKVDGADFQTWSAHKFTSSSNWSDGDFNADGAVGGADFLAWNQHKFAVQGDVVTIRNRVYSDRFVLEDSSTNAVLNPSIDDTSEWIQITNSFGTTFQNRSSGRYLVADNWQVFTVAEFGARSVWQLVDNQDGSFGLRNNESGRYMDGDGASDNWDVDESLELLDDGWIFAAVNVPPVSAAGKPDLLERDDEHDRAFTEPDW